MLLEFGARNYFSFKEGFEASLRLNNNCPESISHGKEFTNVICVKGGNASGKTNILKTIDFIRNFCIDSFRMKPDDEIMLESFFESKDPTDFYIVFKIDDIEYRYELETTQQNVISEVLYKKIKRNTKIVERKYNEIIYTNKDYDEIKMMKLRNNASFISTAHQYDFKSINNVYSFFKNIVTNVNNFGYHGFNPDISKISELYLQNEKAFTFAIEQIKKCDVGINDIKIFDRDLDNGDKSYFPIFYHDLEDRVEALTIHYESSGTKALYSTLFLYKAILDVGGVLVLDEFDINLHPLILPKLIKLFDEEANQKDAQLIFTTHNNKIMDELGKYKTILVNKEKNCSFAYRLDELPGDIVRNDRQISNIYFSGKLGGVPKI